MTATRASNTLGERVGRFVAPARSRKVIAMIALTGGACVLAVSGCPRGDGPPRGSWMDRALVSDPSVAVPPGLRPVRWNRREHPEIGSIAGLGRLWDSFDLSQGSALGLTCDDRPDSESHVRTAAEWAKARRDGCYAQSTVAMMFEAPFIHHASLWGFLEHAEPAAESGLDAADLRALAPMLLPPSVDRFRIERPGDDRWTFTSGTLRRADHATFAWLTPLAVGDYDGDGQEDLFASSGDGYTQGTGRSYGGALYTARPSGRLIDISCRLPPPWLTGGEALAAHRARWQGNCGLPEGTPFRLKGRCECSELPEGTEPRDHWLEVELTMRRGFIEGWYRCRNQPSRVALEGALGIDDRGSLQEFALDNGATAEISFEFRFVDGTLTIDGWRCGTGQIETDDFSASGTTESAAR